MTGRTTPRVRINICADDPDDAVSDSPVWRADLDGRRCRTAQGFLREIGVVLEFPHYYGRNWDAFDECFSDLLEITTGGMGYEFGGTAGRPERVLALVVWHAEELLGEATPRDLGIGVWNLHYFDQRYDPPQPWHRYADLDVTFVCAPEAVDTFAERLRVAERFSPDGTG